VDLRFGVMLRARPRQEDDMQRWKIGAITITRVIEREMVSSARWLLPDASRENLQRVGWLQPHFCNAEGRVIMSVHSFIVESAGTRVLVDTCIGNDKRRSIPDWNMQQGPFLQQLSEAGHPASVIDRVLCTHLHVDHVGWNTRLQDGKWVPTFPNARYLFARSEYAHWEHTQDESSREVMQDSVQPVVDAGLVDLVDSDQVIAEGVHLEPTPGHTPGHVCVHIESQGEHAVITGDLMHHPVQCAHPEWRSSADHDPALAQRTRRKFLADCAGTPTLVLGTHFATPTAGRIVRDGDAFRLEPSLANAE
jgi:glyoxylase-like metal-dependent hydrolase (beta-lactamase superfamily II)